MTSIGLKLKLFLTLSVMLAMGLCLQSLIIIFFDVRLAVSDDVESAKRVLQTLAGTVTGREGLISLLAEQQRGDFGCFVTEDRQTHNQEKISCRFSQVMLMKAKQAKTTGALVVGFAGTIWHVFMPFRETVIIAAPLKDGAGQVIGSLAAERSLLPIYTRYEQEAFVAFLYIMVNTLIFSTLGFFRLVPLIFRPLDRLVKKAENYHPDLHGSFGFGEDDSVFRRLSVSLNSLVQRIEGDNQKLRKAVAELELTNRELQKKNELVVRSEKLASVGRLSAGLAHEIGNPLTIVQGYLELLKRDDLADEEKRDFTGKAHQELDRIKGLIRQLLDFSRPMHLMVAEVSIGKLLEDTIEFVSMEKGFAGCTISTEFSAECDEILVDKDALRQVMVNLLFNALDAVAVRDLGERKITITTENANHDTLGTVIVIGISDNGIGIDEELLSKVFDPFFSTKEVGRGTGLGLYVCHFIVDEIGGNISIRNRSEAGVEVRVELPLQGSNQRIYR